MRSRIVGGEPTEKEDFPYMSVVLRNGRFVCGGVLVHPKIVLTAAHCIQNVRESDLKVGVNRYNLQLASREEVFAHESQVTHILVDPRFSYQSYLKNDLACLILLSAAPNTITPVEIFNSLFAPDNYLSFPDVMLKILGWGRISSNGVTSNLLKMGDIKYVTWSDCRSKWGPSLSSSSHICAAGLNGVPDTCYGDSGGPLLVPFFENLELSFNHKIDMPRYMLLGLTSFGADCAHPTFPSVYANVENSLTPFLFPVMENLENGLYNSSRIPLCHHPTIYQVCGSTSDTCQESLEGIVCFTNDYSEFHQLGDSASYFNLTFSEGSRLVVWHGNLILLILLYLFVFK